MRVDLVIVSFHSSRTVTKIRSMLWDTCPHYIRHIHIETVNTFRKSCRVPVPPPPFLTQFLYVALAVLGVDWPERERINLAQ